MIPEFFGGSADLNPSTLTYLDVSKDFQKVEGVYVVIITSQHSPEGRNVRFGVREHGMAAVCNGLSAYGGFIPFGSTFLNFIGYILDTLCNVALAMPWEQLDYLPFLTLELFTS